MVDAVESYIVDVPDVFMQKFLAVYCRVHAWWKLAALSLMSVVEVLPATFLASAATFEVEAACAAAPDFESLVRGEVKDGFAVKNRLVLAEAPTLVVVPVKRDLLTQARLRPALHRPCVRPAAPCLAGAETVYCNICQRLPAEPR